MASLTDAKNSYLSIYDGMLSATGITIDNLKFKNNTVGHFEYKEYRIVVGNEHVSIIDSGDDEMIYRYHININIKGTDVISRVGILEADFISRETSFLALYQPLLDAKYDTMVAIANGLTDRFVRIINNQSS